MQSNRSPWTPGDGGPQPGVGAPGRVDGAGDRPPDERRGRRVAPPWGRRRRSSPGHPDAIADRLPRRGPPGLHRRWHLRRLGVLDATECRRRSAPAGAGGRRDRRGIGGADARRRGRRGPPRAGRGDLAALHLGAGDVLVAIATSGRTPYVLGGAAYRSPGGAFAIGLACSSAAELSGAGDLAIVPVVGPEVLSGSTR